MLRSQLQALLRPRTLRRIPNTRFSRSLSTTPSEADDAFAALAHLNSQLETPTPVQHFSFGPSVNDAEIAEEDGDQESLSFSQLLEQAETSGPAGSPISDMQRDRAARRLLMEQMSAYGSTQTRNNTFQPHHPLHKPLPPSQATISALIAAGAHLGHSRSLLNPNFMPYVYGNRAGISIIDLDQTLPLLRRAANVTRAIAQRGGSVLFLGTRPDLRPVVEKSASRLGETQGFYVGERWLPGTLTNRMQSFGPDVVRNLDIVPDLVVLLNPLANMNAIRECAISHVPTIGIVDTNADPRIVMYPIPANDESTRTAELIAGVLSLAGQEGKVRRAEELALKAKQKLLQEEKMKRYGSSEGNRKPNNYYDYE